MKCSDCGQDIKPVVALDIDGTLGDYHWHFLRFAQDYFGRPLPGMWNGTGDWEAYLGLTRAEYRECKLAFRQGGQKRTMPTIHGAHDLAHNMHVLGAEVWMTTTRPWMRHDSTDPDTREWLRRNKIYYDHLLYDDLKYGRLSELVDPTRVVAVIDDLPEQYDSAVDEFGIEKVWLHYADHNITARDGRQGSTSLYELGEQIALAIKEWSVKYGYG